MNSSEKEVLIQRLSEALPVLRKQAGLNQSELAAMIDMSKYTILAIEKGQRKMSWSTFLSLVFIFSKNPATQKLLTAFDIETQELNQFLKNSNNQQETKLEEKER